MNRRSFIKNGAWLSSAPFIGNLPVNVWDHDEVLRLTILHTNDVHSRMDPFPMDGSRNAGQGGVAKRAAIIQEIRKESQNVILLDAGDIFQGTPYFNMFKGELEIKAMSQMKYDASTMGNHDFDAGIEGFEKQLKHADFPFIVSNYGFNDTPLKGKVRTNKVFTFQGIRIGIYGLGIELRGLVPSTHYGATQYFDPISIARQYESFLKNEMHCDYVICLSHLGYRYRDETVSDVLLAQNTLDTDLIIGGHTHTFMNKPHIELNNADKAVLINQVGFAGILLGRLDIYFEKGAKRKGLQAANISIS